MKFSFGKYKWLLIIILVALAGCWQLAFMQNFLKYDVPSQYFPWRYFVSDCLNNGIFPLWNPYQHLGYAIHADPQSGVWYPLVWIFSFISGYNAYACQIDFVLHIILAGAGMFLLSNRVIKHYHASIIIAVSYMLSGFFTGNAQHLTYVVSGSWIPFIVYYYLKISERPHWRDVLKMALCFSMLVTGGYPAFTIILSYSLLLIFICNGTSHLLKKDFSTFKKYIAHNLLFLLLSILLSLGILFSVGISLNHIAKSQGLPLEIANYNPFSPQSLLSCLLPLVSAKDPVFFDTDISMSNLYFGIFGFACFVLAFFRKKDFKEKIILAAGILFLLVSFGKYTPLREFLYQYVPLMNLFRFPSIFRYFALICFLLVAGHSLKQLYNDNYKYFLYLRIVLIIFSVFYFVVIALAISKGTRLGFHGFSIQDYYYFFNSLTFWESALLQSVIMLLLIIIFMFYRKINLKALACFVIVDLLIAIQMNAPLTMISEVNTQELQNNMKKQLPDGFPVPQNIPVLNYYDSTNQINGLWLNKSLLFKRPSFDGYNSFRLKGFEQLSEEKIIVPDLVKNNVAFFSQSYSFYNGTIKDKGMLSSQPNHLFFPEALKDKLSFPSLLNSKNDKADFKLFRPDLIQIECNTASTQLLTLMQHDYPGWSVYLNGKITSHYTSDYMFISLLLPAGKNLVEFKFENKTVYIGLLLTIISWLFCLGLLLAKRKSKID